MKVFLRTICTLGVLFCSFVANSANFSIPPSELLYVYDGDTYHVRCRDGFTCIKGKLSIREDGIDTPEIKGKCATEKAMAKQAKIEADKLLRSASTIRIEFNENRPYGKYGRLIGNTSVDGKDLGQHLLDLGLARPYGRGRRSWCEPIIYRKPINNRLRL